MCVVANWCGWLEKGNEVAFCWFWQACLVWSPMPIGYQWYCVYLCVKINDHQHMHLHRYSEHQFHQHHSHQHHNHHHVYHLVEIVMIIIITIMIIIMIVMNAIIIIIMIIIIIIQLSDSEQQPCRYTGLCSHHQQWSVFVSWFVVCHCF